VIHNLQHHPDIFLGDWKKNYEIYYELLRSGQEFEAENVACPKKSLVKYNGYVRDGLSNECIFYTESSIYYMERSP
jgi:hypothetical protein